MGSPFEAFGWGEAMLRYAPTTASPFDGETKPSSASLWLRTVGGDELNGRPREARPVLRLEQRASGSRTGTVPVMRRAGVDASKSRPALGTLEDLWHAAVAKALGDEACAVDTLVVSLTQLRLVVARRRRGRAEAMSAFEQRDGHSALGRGGAAAGAVEIRTCWNAGAKLIKIFPAQLWTPAALKDLRSVGDFKHVSFLPSGGITPDAARDRRR
ncbi:10-hydroxy-9-(phosphonooxy)octadecanoate phosphatase [Aureococcus anophagefferens]|nr:10-hydroxy-9-(phosphonooxy)octadecanoate phosphatase [Aureococcus anophagefferens]